jgi:proteasome lid subunit RPN8/RPN11
MTTASSIRLLPLDTPTPRPGKIPLRYARRWSSEAERVQPRCPGVEVFLTQKAYIRANAHAQSDLENEIGGWLIGSWRQDAASGVGYIVIERCLPALHTRQGSAYLTFTQDSQLAMVGIMEEEFPDKELVGWYHTHPRMSVFFSSYDLFLHNHFFPHPWQVALVIEPHSYQAGFFIRDREGELDGKFYFGFHELIGGQKGSLVRWTNLQAGQSPGEGKHE